MTRQFATPPMSLAHHQSDCPSPSDCLHTIRPAKCPSDRLSPSDRLYTILHRPSDCTTLSDPTSSTPTSPSDHLQPSYRLYDTPPVRQTICNRPIVCTTPPPVRQTIRHRHTVSTTHQSVHQPVGHQPTV